MIQSNRFFSGSDIDPKLLISSVKEPFSNFANYESSTYQNLNLSRPGRQSHRDDGNNWFRLVESRRN